MFLLSIPSLKVNNIVLLFALYVILLLCMVFVVRYEYAFLKAALTYGLNAKRLSVGTGLVILNIGLLTILKLRDFHYAIASLILIFFVLPSAVLFAYVDGYDMRIFVSHNAFFFLLLFAGTIKLRFKSSRLEIQQSRKLLLLVVIVGIAPFVFLYSPYINLKNLILKDIYETRASMDATINNLYTDYSYSWFNKFIIPCLLVFAVYYRDRFAIVVGSLALIFLFLCGAHKAVFVGLVVTFVLYKYDYVTKINYFVKLLIGIAIFSLAAALIFDMDFFMTMSIRRAFLLPAMMDILYFDMFDHKPLLWSETFNGLFKVYPLDLEHSYAIGEKYFSDPTWGANNGIISDGFMNAGMTGVLINITIISIYFSILNQLNISPKFFGLFFLFVFLIVSSSLPTVMLTHGGFILIILAFLFMKNTSDQMRN